MNYNMKRQACVYGLRSGASYGYVGATRVNPKTRWWEHRSRARAGHDAPVYHWMRRVGIDTVEIDVLDDDPANEPAWIDKLVREGHPIANDQSLGLDLYANGPSMKKKIGEANKGKPTWIKGLKGEAAGWTPERRAAQAERFRKMNEARKAK